MEPLRRILIAAFLFFLPFSILLWINDQVIREEWDESVRENAEQLNQIVAHFARLAQPLTFFQQAIGRVKRALIWGEDAAGILPVLASNGVKLYSFDARGKRTRIPGFEEGLKMVSEQNLECIRASARQRGWQMSPKERNLAESFFGSPNVIDTLAGSPGKLISLDFFGLARTVGVFPFRDRRKKAGFLLVSIENLKVSHLELARQALRKIKRLAGPGFDFGFIDLGGQIPDQLLGMSRIPGGVRQQMISAASEPLIRDGTSIWSLNIIARKFLLFGRCPETPPLGSFSQRQSSFMAAGVASFLCFLLVQALLVQRGVSVRIQLLVLVLFSLAGAGSILTLFGFARAYIDIRQKTLLRERCVQTREILEKIDHSFSFYQEGLARRYKDLCRSIGPHLEAPAKGDRPGASSTFALDQKFPKGLSVAVFDGKGKTLWRKASGADSNLATMYGKDFPKIVSRIAGLVVNCFNAVILEGSHLRVLTESQESPYVKQSVRKLHDTQGRIYDIAFGKGKFSVFLDYVLGDKGFARGGIWITHPEDLIERSYLHIVQQNQKRYSYSDDYAFRLVPLKKHGFQVGRNKRLPWGAIRDFHDLVSQVKIPVFRKERLRGQSILVTGIPGKKLQDYNLVMITSLANLEREGKSLFHGFLAFSFLIVLFAVSLSVVFSEILLEPIQQLTKGLLHLSESHFSTPVKIRTGDELQVVGDGINEIFEEMGELSIARSIQEHLIPAGPLSLNSWSCRGWGRSHSEIGGEIYDYLPLPRDRMLLWMAGVPGHSIESALVLAMTKMAVRTLVDLKSEDSSGLYREVAETVREKTHGFEGGSLLVGILDQLSGSINITGDGRFLLGTTGSGSGSLDGPEGAEVNGFFTRALVLAPGTRLFILSKGCWDGTRSPETTEIAMKEWLSEMKDVSSDALDQAIFQGLERFNPAKAKLESQSILMLEGKRP